MVRKPFFETISPRNFSGEGGQEEEDEGRDGGGAVAVVLYALPDGSQIKDDWERAVDGSTEASEQLVPGISVLE